MSNDTLADALPVTITGQGGTYTSPPVDFAGYPGDIFQESYGGYYSAWWVYEPGTNGEAVFDTSGTAAYTDLDTQIVLYYLDEAATEPDIMSLWEVAQVGAFDNEHMQAALTFAVEAGYIYYVRVLTSEFSPPPEARYVLAVTGPPTGAGVRVGDPAFVDADAPAPQLSGQDFEVPAEPALVDVDVPPGVDAAAPEPVDLDTPAATAVIDVPEPLHAYPVIVWRNTAEGGTDGAQVTVGNSGGVSGDPFTAVQGTVTVATVGDTLAYQYDAGTNPGTLSTNWETDPTGSPLFGGRVEFRVSTYPMTLWTTNNLRMHVAATGYLTLTNDATGYKVVELSAVGINTWRRVEWSLNFGTGAFKVWYYTDRTSTSPFGNANGGAGPWLDGTFGEFTGIHLGPQTASAGVLHLDNIEANNTATMPGPYVAPPAAITLAAPAATAEVNTPAVDLSIEGLISAPAAVVAVVTPPPLVLIPIGLSAPPALADVTAPKVSLLAAVVNPVYPPAGTISPSLTPRFRVGVRTDDPGARVEVQYANTGAFEPSTILSAEVPYGLTTTPVMVKAGVPLINNVAYVWRARVVNDFDATAWTAAIPFTISQLDGEAYAGGSWTVDPNHIPDAFLWWTVPDRGRPGDLVVAVGTGFGPNSATVTVSGVVAPGDLYGVAANDRAFTADRRITRDTDDVDPGHMRVDFQVPLVGPPAGPLYVDGA